MLAVFLKEDKTVLFTYPIDILCLNTNDTIVFQNHTYVITRKEFNVDIKTIHFFLKLLPRKDETP